MITKEAWYIEAEDKIEKRLLKIEEEHKAQGRRHKKMVKRLRNIEREVRYLAQEMEQ